MIDYGNIVVAIDRPPALGIKIKTALITGIKSLDDFYMAKLLLEKSYMVHGMSRRSPSFHTGLIYRFHRDPAIMDQKLFVHHGGLTDANAEPDGFILNRPPQNSGGYYHYSGGTYGDKVYGGPDAYASTPVADKPAPPRRSREKKPPQPFQITEGVEDAAEDVTVAAETESPEESPGSAVPMSLRENIHLK